MKHSDVGSQQSLRMTGVRPILKLSGSNVVTNCKRIIKGDSKNENTFVLGSALYFSFIAMMIIEFDVSIQFSYILRMFYSSDK